MAVDMFLKVDGIEGESMDDTHLNEIDVLAWSWGLSQSGTMHIGGGGGAGKVNVQDISITKYFDKASAPLMQACMSGLHIPEVSLVVRKSGGEQLEYIIIKFTEVLVSSLSTGGSGGEDRLTENLSLNFAKVETIYKPQSGDGTVGADVTSGWDIQANKTLV
ncbi:UNVERIFIED_CONTAM: hypothetical protein GTU68_007375 [Idotea baltica]|nr:hypothetical protein [Idotea baltica]